MSKLPQPPPIEGIDKLIKPHLNGGRLLSYESEYFTAPGDNYGSTIFSVMAKVENPKGSKSDLSLVAKLLPEIELYRIIFQPERTFITELSCYTVAAPAFIKLQKDAGIPSEEITDVFAQFYGGRISLDEKAEKVDMGAALLLENLTAKGYKMEDRLKGFDYETTLVILRDLARFHAMAVAYRFKYPDEFEKTFKPFLQPFYVDNAVPDDMRMKLLEDNLDIIKNLPGMDDKLFGKVMTAFSVYEDHLSKMEPCKDSLFSTISHNDFWTNNMMICYDNNGKPKNIKIVDFQVATYDSSIHDLLFFLVLNVQVDIIQAKFDNFLKAYYEFFVGWLQRLGCNTSEYSYEKFDSEIHEFAIANFRHIIKMLKVISLSKEKLSQIEERSLSNIMNDKLLDESFPKKLASIVYLFNGRGYLEFQIEKSDLERFKEKFPRFYSKKN